jgi:nitroreductase
MVIYNITKSFSSMQLDDCIKDRRSVRIYNRDSMPKELVETVLEAGVWAATGMGRQPWRFIIIENKEIIKFISEETKKAVREAMPVIAKRFETVEDIICYNAPVLIFICSEVDSTFGQINLRDSVLAAQNMFLKAHELGLGGCYMGWIDLLYQTHPEILKKAVIPEGYQMQVPLILGYPKSKSASGKRNKPNIIKWIK